MAITVHLERKVKPFMMLLDLVEVAELHTGVNLGITFANVLKKFGIEDKISTSKISQRMPLTSVTHDADTWYNRQQCVEQ
jgi:hypothetical protein